MYTSILQCLETTKFPKNTSRKNVGNSYIECFALGLVPYRGQKSLGGKLKGPSRWNKKHPELLELVQNLIKTNQPGFEYTTIQINKNIQSLPHIDKNNMGSSYIIALGNYEGGKLVLEGDEFDIKNTWLKFDGRLGHWVKPFTGTRYSLVYFTHTFKPPCPSLRHVTVTEDGLYKKNIKIKSYIK